MNFLRIFYTMAVAALIATSAAYAGGNHHSKSRTKHHACPCKPCKKTPVGSFEKCLCDIRGTATVNLLAREEGSHGSITGINLIPTRGIETFTVQNANIRCVGTDDLLARIFYTEVATAGICRLTFDVTFTCPCTSDPSVVMTLESPLLMKKDGDRRRGALVNSVATAVHNVTPFGFTVDVFFSIYATSTEEANDLLAAILSPNQFSVNFIAQCK